MDKSRVEPTIFFIEKISFSLKLFSGHFYGQSFIKTVRGPLWLEQRNLANAFLKEKGISMHKYFSTFNNDLNSLYVSHREDSDISACHCCVMQYVYLCINCDMNIPISPTS